MIDEVLEENEKMENPFEGGLFGLSKARTDIITSLTDSHEMGNHDDIVAAKMRVLEDFYKDSDLLLVLNNPDLKDSPPEDYRNVNIFSFMKIPETQTQVKNFLCFEINDREPLDNNDAFITRQLIVRTISHEKDVDTPWGIDRQDLLALIVKDRLAWSNCLGTHLKKVYDCGKIAENGYYFRDMYFEALVPNGLYKATKQNNLDRKSVNNPRRDVYDKRRFD